MAGCGDSPKSMFSGGLPNGFWKHRARAALMSKSGDDYSLLTLSNLIDHSRPKGPGRPLSSSYLTGYGRLSAVTLRNEKSGTCQTMMPNGEPMNFSRDDACSGISLGSEWAAEALPAPKRQTTQRWSWVQRAGKFENQSRTASGGSCSVGW
ncbi:hypothetical protein VTI74DRAFT_5429 [Chaetomium olivicolor]